jgi:hypothetical protein
MIDNKKIGSEGTTKYAQGVYFFVTLLLLVTTSLWSPNSHAQMIDLAELNKWSFEGQSRVYSKRPCIFKAGDLTRDAFSRSVQDIELTVLPNRASEEIISKKMRIRNIRMKAPDTCASNTRLCTYEIPLRELDSENKESSSYFMELSSPLSDPYLISNIRIYFLDRFNSQRNYWDCQELRQTTP